MDVLLTLVADRYRTEKSRAALAGLQCAARRSGLARAVRPAFWPERGDLPVGELLRGAEALALVLDAGQRDAGDALLAAWEAATAGRGTGGVRVLPVIVTAASEEGAWAERLARLGVSLPPVLIRPDRDVRLEHGGAVFLSDEAQRTLNGRAAAAVSPGAPAWGIARNSLPAVTAA